MKHGTIYYDASDDTFSVVVGWVAALVVGAAFAAATAWALKFAVVQTVAALAIGIVFAMVAYGIGTDVVYAARMARLDRKATKTILDKKGEQ